MKIEWNKLRAARHDMGMTQKDLSAQTGVHLSVIKAIETGRGTDRQNIEKIAEVLKIPMEDVYLEDFRETKVISVVNNKGGCGKTSVCGSLAFVLAEWDYRVLLVDSDAQRNLTSSYGMPKGGMHFGRAIEREESLMNGYIQPTAYPNIDMVVADASMGTLDMMMFTKMHRENLVCQTLREVVASGNYDYVLIDTNPNLSLLNFNVVNASDHVIIPVQMASFDVEGIGTVVDFIRGIQKFNPRVNIMGIVINKYDMRTRSITEAAEQELQRIYGDLIFNTYIKVDVKIQNAQWENRPVFTMGASRVAREYRSLAKEVIARCKNREMLS